MTDAKAISEIYDEYAPALYGRILSVVQHKDIAEKILEKIFINAFVDKTAPVNKNLSIFTSLINHSRKKSYSMLKAVKILQECNCNSAQEEDYSLGLSAPTVVSSQAS